MLFLGVLKIVLLWMLMLLRYTFCNNDYYYGIDCLLFCLQALVPTDCPPVFLQIALKCCEYEPKDRYDTGQV